MNKYLLESKNPTEYDYEFVKMMDSKHFKESVDSFYSYWNDFLIMGKLPSYSWLKENLCSRDLGLSILTQRFDIFQFYSKEFILDIAHQIKELNSDKIIEIGAGNGFLSYFLAQEGINIIATDNMAWEFPRLSSVENLDHLQALKKYNPEVVIICWEDLGKEYSIDILNHPSVKYLIWIGEKKGWSCGTSKVFEKFNYEEIASNHLFCKTDTIRDDTHSRVYLFNKNDS